MYVLVLVHTYKIRTYHVPNSTTLYYAYIHIINTYLIQLLNEYSSDDPFLKFSRIFFWFGRVSVYGKIGNNHGYFPVISNFWLDRFTVINRLITR